MYQTCFKNVYTNIKNYISYLPQECQRSYVISLYIHDYKFDFVNVEMDEQKTILLELQKLHYIMILCTHILTYFLIIIILY